MSVSSTLTSPPARTKGQLLVPRRKIGQRWTLKLLADRSQPGVNAQGCWEWKGNHWPGHPGSSPRPAVAICPQDYAAHPDLLPLPNQLFAVARLICILRGDEDLANPTYEAQHAICDNGWCVNPDHIVWGPKPENTRDRMNRKQGYKTSNGYFTVPQLRAAYWLSQSTLTRVQTANRVGVRSKMTIMRIAQGRHPLLQQYFAGDGPPQNSDLA